MSDRPSGPLGRSSLQVRLPLLVGGLLLGSSILLYAAAFLRVRQEGAKAVGERLTGVVGQLGSLLETQSRNMRTALLQVAGRPELRAYLLRPSESAERAAFRVLWDGHLRDSSMVAISIRDTGGRVLAAQGPMAEQIVTILDPRELPREATEPSAVGMFRALEGLVYFPTIAAVRDGNRLLGFVTYWRRVNRAAGTRGPVAQLIGSDAVMLMGSQGGAWMSEAGPEEPPALGPGPAPDGFYHYARPEGPVLASAAAVATTPWMVVVEFPARVVNDPATRFLATTAPVGGLVIVFGLLVAWVLGRRLTRPLVALTQATDAMTTGDLSGRVSAIGNDEVGRLGAAFNRLAEQLEREASARSATERQWQAVFEGSPHPKWVEDRETGAILAVNPAALRGYGHTREEFLALHADDLVAAQTPGAGDQGALRHRRRDGSVIEVELTTHDLTFGARPARFVLAQNVTRRNQLEAVFRQAQKMEAVGRLAGGVAHDFNNFLTAIGAYAELVRDSLPPEDQRAKDLEEILRATAQANRLTRQLLTFTRQQVVRPAVLDLDSAVHAMTELLRRLIPEDIEVTIDLRSDHARVRMDVGHLEQALMNLVVNGRDAMPTGGRLTVSTTRHSVDAESARLHGLAEGGEFAALTVADSGVGMSAEIKARIFEPFFTTKPEGHGTGLGLATVYGIVSQNGGHITVYSEVGHGTTFRIYLPLVAEAPSAESPVQKVGPELRGTETILLVEDEAAVRAAAQDALQRQGYVVLPAAHPSEALDLIAKHQGTIDLVISDVVMPKMDGPTLIGRLRQERPGLKALLMSGYAGAALPHLDGNGYDVPFLEKPFTVVGLLRKVREVLRS